MSSINNNTTPTVNNTTTPTVINKTKADKFVEKNQFKPEFLKTELKHVIFKEMMKDALNIPKLIAAPFSILINSKSLVRPVDTNKSTANQIKTRMANVARVVLLSPLALLASIHIATFLLVGAPVLAVTALLNAATAAHTGQDLTGKSVELEMVDGKIKVGLTRLTVNDGSKEFNEMGGAKGDTALYTEVKKTIKQELKSKNLSP